MNTKDSNPGAGANHAGNKIICFDVDGTLRDYRDQPRNEVISVLLLYVRAGWRVCVWSGGGIGYARSIGNMLKLPEPVEYIAKRSIRPDIAVDDQRVNLGEKNVYVGTKESW